jgi:hypothetical protein
MTASDVEIVEYVLDMIRHGANCALAHCSSCEKLNEIVDVVRDMIFDTDPLLDVSGAAISAAATASVRESLLTV